MGIRFRTLFGFTGMWLRTGPWETPASSVLREGCWNWLFSTLSSSRARFLFPWSDAFIFPVGLLQAHCNLLFSVEVTFVSHSKAHYHWATPPALFWCPPAFFFCSVHFYSGATDEAFYGPMSSDLIHLGVTFPESSSYPWVLYCWMLSIYQICFSYFMY
jgi:hypothetical protein